MRSYRKRRPARRSRRVRRFSRRRRFSRKRRFSRRRRSTGRTFTVWRHFNPSVYSFGTGDVWGNNAVVVALKLSDVADYTTLRGLYKEYRINKLVFNWEVNGYPSTANIGLKDLDPAHNLICTHDPPLLVSVVDTDGMYTSATTVSSVAQDPSAKVDRVYPGKHYTRSFKPCYLLDIYAGSGTSYKPSRGWLPTESSSIIWYGLKWGVDCSKDILQDFTGMKIRPDYYVQYTFRKPYSGKPRRNYIIN